MLCILRNMNGAIKDIRRLRNIFTQHRFHYSIKINPAKKGVFCAIRRFRASLLDREIGVSCCVVVIMAHGRIGYINAADKVDVELQEIYGKCPALWQIPKTSIVQKNKGGSSHDVSSTCQEVVPVVKLPLASDTLIVHTVYPGKLAHRHSEYGCRLTFEIERVFKEHACTHHMFELFPKVNEQLVHNEWSAEGYEQDSLFFLHPFWRQPVRTGKAANEDKEKDPMHIQSTLTIKWYL